MANGFPKDTVKPPTPPPTAKPAAEHTGRVVAPATNPPSATER